MAASGRGNGWWSKSRHLHFPFFFSTHPTPLYLCPSPPLVSRQVPADECDGCVETVGAADEYLGG